METYLLKFSACLLVFWLVYVLLLERHRMHQFKRFYLLGSIAVAIIIPLLTITYYVEPVITDLEAIPTFIPIEPDFTNAYIEKTPKFSLENILWLIYGVGVLLLTIRFIVNLVRMYFRISKNEKISKRSFLYVLLKDYRIPHSFFKYIFLNKFKFENNNIPKEVLLHEETHAKQLHSIDIIILELLQIVFWFHPLIYLLKHHVKLNHEFLADQAVLEQGTDTKNYQNILLQFSSNTQEYQLSSAINYSSIKKRFTVMKTQTSKTRIWLSILLLLPIIAILFYSFAEKEYVEKELNESSELLKIENEFQLDEHKTIKVHLANGNQLYINDKPGNLKTLELFLKKLPKTEKYDLKISSEKETSSVAFFEALILLKKHKILYTPNKIEWDKVDHFLKDYKVEEYEEYIKKHKKYEALRTSKPHYINKSEKEQKQMDALFSDLGGMYFRMSKANKAKVKRPIAPILPYAKITLNGKTYFKNKSELTEEEKATLPPPPPPPSKGKTKGGPGEQELYNPSFIEYIIEMEQLGASFYLDDKKVSVEKAKSLAKNNKGKSTAMLTKKDADGKYVVKLSSPEKNNNYARSIEIKILNDDSYLIGGIKATKKTFTKVINQLHQDITPEIRSKIMNIHVSSSNEISNKEVWFIYNSLQDYGFYRIVTPNQEINRAKGNTPFAIESNSSTQQKATKQQVAEYNKLARHYNTMIEDGKSIQIKMKHVERMKYIYGLMSKEQRNNAEPFPNFPKPPPPPEPIAIEVIEEQEIPAPPPPPIPENVSQEELKRMKKVIENYKKKHPESVTKATKNGEIIEIVEIPRDDEGKRTIDGKEYFYKIKDGETTYYDRYGNKVNLDKIPPPPPPESTLDFVIRMAKKNAKFFHEGKSISSDKAIELLKKNPKLNISAQKTDTRLPLIYISKKPILIGVKGKSRN